MQISPNHLFLNSAEVMREICKPLQKLLIDHFSFTRTYASGKRIYLSTHPDLLQSYFNNKYYLIGSCESKPNLYINQKLIWSSLPEKKMYADARQRGIVDGVFITEPQQKYSEFFNFGTTRKDVNIANLYLTHYDILNNFLFYFKQKAKPLISESEKLHFYLPYPEKKVITCLPPSQQLFSKASSPKNNKLSKQQYQCALRLITGASFKKIAEELHLSPRTVETYVQNMRDKFGAENRTSLVIMLNQLLLGE